MEKSSVSHFAAACLHRSCVMAFFFSFHTEERFYCPGPIFHESTECLQLRWPLCVSARGCTFFLQLFTRLEDERCTTITHQQQYLAPPARSQVPASPFSSSRSLRHNSPPLSPVFPALSPIFPSLVLVSPDSRRNLEEPGFTCRKRAGRIETHY